MKNTAVVGPIAGLLLAVAGLLSSRATPALPAPPAVTVVRWQHGDAQKRLMPADRGFCYVSGMGGNFQGGGEGVRVFVDDGIWFVDGHSCQPSLWVEVTCIEWPAAPPHGNGGAVVR
ncbi:MAG TPA: hypothetical protein VFZ65_16205 [Planctomycetota bacterium]|nr:hypothetical protein [Planctomycetota bacterium]